MPDVDDRHVLAAAIRCNASVIVTFNEKDFPPEILSNYAMETQHPDVFAENLFDLDHAAVIAAAQRQRQQLKHPPVGVDDVALQVNLDKMLELSRETFTA